MLKEGEYWGHEVYFPDGNPPQDTFDKLGHHGFERTDDDTYFIPRESLGLFITGAEPYRVAILQPNCLCGGVITPEDMDGMLDMINQLKKAGVQGIESFYEKIGNCL